MQIGSFGTAHIAYGKAETIDEKSLVTIVECEDTLNTAAIMLEVSPGYV
jgi:benzoyl-CoA reductase/2-hydroxyglutaryl-CoA dehydratase subunit BcrC/BadD/HgdB